jgi:hypothetical protein
MSDTKNMNKARASDNYKKLLVPSITIPYPEEFTRSAWKPYFLEIRLKERATQV